MYTFFSIKLQITFLWIKQTTGYGSLVVCLSHSFFLLDRWCLPADTWCTLLVPPRVLVFHILRFTFRIRLLFIFITNSRLILHFLDSIFEICAFVYRWSNERAESQAHAETYKEAFEKIYLTTF